MLTLVTANNFLQLFFGWEGVGLASYLLIGFWYQRPSANAAAIKAFIVNRVGDFGFALGVFGVYYVFGTLDFERVFAAAPMFAGKSFIFAGYSADILTTLCILLFIGAMGKSAQLGLHTWLPDAMEGPTPVSALNSCRDHGHRRRIPRLPLFTAVSVIPHRTRIRHLHWRDNRVLCRLGRSFPERHQAGDRLFHLFSARLHVCRCGGIRLWRRHVSSVHARFKALLFLGAGSVISRDASRTGHAQNGRSCPAASRSLGP